MSSLRIFVLNPMTSASGNVVRDVLYGCWCAGKRIGGASVPPFALLQVATVLREAGHDVVFLDAQAEQKPYEQVSPLLVDCDLLLCTTSTMSFQEDADCLLRLKQAHPRLRTVIFGSHPTFMPQYALAHNGIDIIVRREPEWILRDLAARMAQGEEWTTLEGIGFRDGAGKPVINPDYPLIENLDELPLPDPDWLTKGIDYFNPIVRRMPYMTASTSRGCPGLCTFCTAPYFDGRRVRFQSAEYVLRLIGFLAGKGYREIYFRDDTFFVNRQRDHEIFRQIVEKKLDVTWIANARVGMIDEETMALAKKAGCHTIKFGIESGSQAILDRIKKGYRIERAHEVFAAANRIGINTHAHTMIGNPGDTRETIDQTIEFVNALNPTTATFGLCTPYPGTPLFEELAQTHPEIRDGSASDLSNLHTEGLYNEFYCDVKREELQKLVPYAYRRFYLRSGKLCAFLRDQIRSWQDMKRVTLAGTRVLDFMLSGKS